MADAPSPNPIHRMLRIVGGGILLAVGVAGLILPILPGWIFIIPGLSLWATEFHWAARLRRRASVEYERHRDRLARRRQESGARAQRGG